MHTSTTSTEVNAARGRGADAEHATVAARGDSRLVTQDERETEGLPLAADESSVTYPFPDLEVEIFRLESRGDRAELVAYPMPLDSANPAAAHIDWCAFTVRGPGDFAEGWIAEELHKNFGFDRITQRRTGLYGYKHSAIIKDGGLAAWGGKNQRNTVYVSLNATGCARIKSWTGMFDWCVRRNARLTRVDPAHDDLTGASMTIDKAHSMWLQGGFNAGGR